MQQARTNQPVLDAVKYKQTTLEQWNRADEAWHRLGSLLSRCLGPATETMLDMADITQGSRVLDVAAGAGEQGLARFENGQQFEGPCEILTAAGTR